MSKTRKRTSRAGRYLKHGPPSFSALHGVCIRCGRLCRFPNDDYGDGLCIDCKEEATA